MSLYVVDIDGTIADLSHRLDFIKTKPKNWPAFEKGCSKDVPITPVIRLANDLFSAGHQVIYCSGRSSKARERTETWLKEHNVLYTALLMREEGDYRRDDIVKQELHEQIWAKWGVPVLYIDDRNQVVDMIRDRGDICLQVQPGNF